MIYSNLADLRNKFCLLTPNSSVELDKVFSDRQTEIKKLRDQISTKSEALETVKADNSSKAVELTALRSRAESIRAMAACKKKKNLEILSEFEAIKKERQEEIGRKEERIAQQQADCDNAKKVHTDIIDEIHSKFGNSKSLEEMTVQAKEKMEKIDAECFRLNDTVDGLCRTVQSYENKVEQLEMAEKEFFQQVR